MEKGASAALCMLLSMLSSACGNEASGAELLQTTLLKPIATIELDGVRGRLDHLAVDRERKRLYVAARSHGTIEVIDLEDNSLHHTIRDVPRAQDVIYVEDLDVVIASSGEEGLVLVFDGETLEEQASLKVGRDADSLRYDPRKQRLFVGWGEGAISAVDTVDWTVAWSFATNGHPESFQVHSDGLRIFANVPAAKQVVVVDRNDHALIAQHRLAGRSANYPLLLLEEENLLVVGCREPGELLFLELSTGKHQSSQVLAGDVDDLFHDPAAQRIYAACGEGFLDVFEKRPDGEYRRAFSFETAPGARTCLFDPVDRRLYLAVPGRPERDAQIRVYEVEP